MKFACVPAMNFSHTRNHGVIGNSFSAALVTPAGSIDWCCFPFLDSPSHFGAYFNESHGGRFQILPQGEYRAQVRYLSKSLVLETTFETPSGTATLLDWMPSEQAELCCGPAICRRIEVHEGSVSWILTCIPRFRYGSDWAQAEEHRHGILFRGSQPDDLALLQSPIPLEVSANGASAVARFSLIAGSPIDFIWSWGRPGLLAKRKFELESTLDYWKNVAHQCESPSGCIFGGPWHDLVTRSSLLLSLLSASYSGAISEAVSILARGHLPGGRTWSYRLAPLRQGAFYIQALIHTGNVSAAQAYFSWVAEILSRDGVEKLQPYYTLDGGRVIPEREILTVPEREIPYRFQLDIYGHVVMTFYEYYKAFGEIPKGTWPKLVDIADYICQAWKRPDYGPWGIAPRPEHFVASKVFCWVALQQISELAHALGNSPAPRWSTEKDILFKTICSQGFDSSQNSFVRSFGDREVDSSCLWIPLLNFLPPEDPRIQGTLVNIRNQLSDGVFLKRMRLPYERPEQEAADLWSSLLFVSCLALTGHADEASDRLAEICSYAGPLGLFGDMIDPFQKNGMSAAFPSASAHLLLINAALYIGAARARQKPLVRLIGSEQRPKAA